MKASPATSFGVRNEYSSNFGSSTNASGGEMLGDPRRVVDVHDLAEHRLQQPVEVGHVRGPEVDLVVDRAARLLVDVLAEFLRVVDADAHRQLLEQRRRQLRLGLEARRRAGRRAAPRQSAASAARKVVVVIDLLRRIAAALPFGQADEHAAVARAQYAHECRIAHARVLRVLARNREPERVDAHQPLAGLSGRG